MTTKPDDHPAVIPCPAELAAILATMRPDTNEHDWRGAMLACQTAGWPWLRTYLQIALILRDHGGPRDLLNAAGPIATRHRQDQLKVPTSTENHMPADKTAWRKASGCHANGTCVELALTWRTATASTSSNCVQIAAAAGHIGGAGHIAAAGWIAVRDSKNPHHPHLNLKPVTFAALTHGLKTAT